MDDYLISSSGLAVAAIASLLVWLKVRRRVQRGAALEEQGRLDTLIGWPPEAVRMLRTPERAAYNVLTLALPGQMIFAQVPLARFINVPKRFSHAEWMRRVGSHCVDFVVCDAASKVIAVVDVRPSATLINERLERRLERVGRTLKAAGIPLHVWIDTAVPTVEVARDALARSLGAVAGASRPSHEAPAAARPVYDSGDLSKSRSDAAVEIIEMTDARASTWFDELEAEPMSPPPAGLRTLG